MVYGIGDAMDRLFIDFELPTIGEDERLMAASLGVIAGGAVGNGVDRLLYASVTDFVRFYSTSGPLSELMVRTIGSNAWPTFNIADVALLLGLAAAGLGMFLQEDAEDLSPDPPAKLIAD